MTTYLPLASNYSYISLFISYVFVYPPSALLMYLSVFILPLYHL